MLTLACPIESRDQTLSQDSKLLNCYWESNSSGKRVVVKRLGIIATGPSILPSVGPDYCQGLVSWGSYNFGISQDKVQQILSTGIAPTTLATPVIPWLTMTTLSNILTSAGGYVSLIQSVAAMWVMTGTTAITKVTSANYPANTVPGVAYLDGTYYVMNTAGNIQGSALEDPLTWSALNFISTDRGLGPPVALTRHLNYIAAFCERGVQFFYNAANPAPGSPLLPSGNTLVTVGCKDAKSIQVSGDKLIFLAIDAGHKISVMAFNGLSLSTLSTPAVERILAYNTIAQSNSSMIVTFEGHTFYVLTLVSADVTLALDLTTGDWAQWSSSSDGVTDSMFRGALSITAGSYTDVVVLDRSSGGVYKFAGHGDLNQNFTRAGIRTRSLDHDSTSRKFLSQINLVGDTSLSTVKVRYSDDDCVTWSPWRTIDMSTQKKQLNRLGSFYKRTFEFLQLDGGPMRLEGLLLPDSASPGVSQPEGE
jgi:hypothetical protein